MNEQMHDEVLRQLARDATNPPPTPREEIWAAIQERRGGELGRRRRMRLWQGRLGWAVGIAAALLIGVGLGRWSMRPGAPAPVVATAAAPEASGLAYRVNANQHLSQAEALLTLTRSTRGAEELDAQAIAWAGDLLTTTRLLLDSPAADDPALRALLEDLELVLAGITHLRTGGAPARSQEELDLVKESIEQGGVLPRLRTAIPSGVPAAAAT